MNKEKTREIERFVRIEILVRQCLCRKTFMYLYVFLLINFPEQFELCFYFKYFKSLSPRFFCIDATLLCECVCVSINQ